MRFEKTISGLMIAVLATAAAATKIEPSQINNFNGAVQAQVADTPLSGLSDVASTTPTDGQALTWKSATSKWTPGAGGGGALPDIFGLLGQQIAQQLAADGYQEINESYIGKTIDCGGIVGFAMYQNMKDAVAGPTKTPAYTVTTGHTLIAILNKQSDSLMNGQSFYHGGMYANGTTNNWVFTWGSPSPPLNGTIVGQYGGISGTGYGGNSAAILWPHAVAGDSVYLQLYTNGDTNRATQAMVEAYVLDASNTMLPITACTVTSSHS